MAAQVGSLDYVMIWAPDVAALVAEYRVALGAVAIEESYPAWARIRLANVDIGVHQHPEGAAGRGAELVFRVHDVAAFRADLAGTPFQVGEYDAIPGGVRLSFRDSVGNALGVVQWGARLVDLEVASPSTSA